MAETVSLTVELPRIDCHELVATLDAYPTTLVASMLGAHRSTIVAIHDAARAAVED